MYDATPTQLSQKTKQQLALMVAKDGESSWLVYVLLDIGTCIIAFHSWSQAWTWGKMLTSDSKSDWVGLGGRDTGPGLVAPHRCITSPFSDHLEVGFRSWRTLLEAL